MRRLVVGGTVAVLDTCARIFVLQRDKDIDVLKLYGRSGFSPGFAAWLIGGGGERVERHHGEASSD